VESFIEESFEEYKIRFSSHDIDSVLCKCDIKQLISENEHTYREEDFDRVFKKIKKSALSENIQIDDLFDRQ
jgi:hypothetical protein